MILALLQETAARALTFPGAHSVLRPHGPQALRIHELWRFLWIVALVVWVLVVAALLWGAFRRHGPEDGGERSGGGPGMHRAVVGATALTVVVLVVFLVFDFSTGRALTMAPGGELHVQVTGHQWWWEVEYPHPEPYKRATTANEIHVPVGVPVVVELQAADVIHSFWAPSLTGKRDLIPRVRSSLWFQADTPGVYRGQCAEFCGYQHAKMGFQIIAEPRAQFEAWLARQRDSARTPADTLARRGRQVFLASSCPLCHTIAGTMAGGNVGPDLTHLASRRTLAAGTLPNTRGNLAGWIVDPQRIKPGVIMPANQLAPRDLQALLAYLETLE
ncbi:MAG TPA: cytochrome c oxidase subunit II [Gemmatimonadales bacterium]|nr:cytochrome c oxidase subunit II [Gemmatimonadales bacterium]